MPLPLTSTYALICGRCGGPVGPEDWYTIQTDPRSLTFHIDRNIGSCCLTGQDTVLVSPVRRQPPVLQA